MSAHPMPALHDFSRFVFFSHQVSAAVRAQFSDEHLTQCGNFVRSLITIAQSTLGNGKPPGPLIHSLLSVCKYELSSQLRWELSQLRTSIVQLPTGGYGVLNLYSAEGGSFLLRCVSVACVDDLLADEIWRNAFRHACEAVQPDDDFCLAVIAHAVAEGSVFAKLGDMQFAAFSAADIAAMYGQYVQSGSVSGLEILRDVLRSWCALGDSDRETTEMRFGDAETLQAGFLAVIWNLMALDENGTEVPIPITTRVGHNIRMARLILAGMQADTQADSATRYGRIALHKDISAADKHFREQRVAARHFVHRLRTRGDGKTYVTHLRGRQVGAWAWIVLVVSGAVLMAVLNVGQRDNAFDRVKDSLDFATTLLVTVFGLVKLTSEDANALKSLAIGTKLVANLQTAAGFYRPGTARDVRMLLATHRTVAAWAERHGACYARVVREGGLDAGPAGVRTLKGCGFFLLESVCKRPFHWDTCHGVRQLSLDCATFQAHHADPGADNEDSIDLASPLRYSEVA